MQAVSTEDCWLYAGPTWQDYGKISYRIGPRRITVRAHRVMYENLVGPIPEKLPLDHLCRVRQCINPAHLEPVTYRENNIRSLEARGYMSSRG